MKLASVTRLAAMLIIALSLALSAAEAGHHHEEGDVGHDCAMCVAGSLTRRLAPIALRPPARCLSCLDRRTRRGCPCALPGTTACRHALRPFQPDPRPRPPGTKLPALIGLDAPALPVKGDLAIIGDTFENTVEGLCQAIPELLHCPPGIGGKLGPFPEVLPRLFPL